MPWVRVLEADVQQADLINSGVRRGKGTTPGGEFDRPTEPFDQDGGGASFWSRPNRVGADQGDMGY